MGREKNESDSAKGLVNLIRIGSVVLLVLFAAFNSAYFTNETETAVITTFGAATENPGKGLQFKIPFVQKVRKVDTTVKELTIGYKEDENGQQVDVDSESVMITSDYNFIDIDFHISYQVKDPIKYLYASSNPDLILKNIAMSSIRSTVSAYPVDAAITTGKAEIEANIEQLIVEQLEKEDIGIVLVNALIQDAEPPVDDVKSAFTAVETARADKESYVNEANKYRNEQLPAAEADANKILQDAEAKKTARINQATGEAAKFLAEYEEYKKYPLITKERMFYEAMEEILPKLKIVIDNGNGDIQKYYPIESFATFNGNGGN